MASTEATTQSAAGLTKVERARALTGTLMLSGLLLMAFLVGSYVLVRYGRMALARSKRGKRTEYVDAWSHYRLSEEELDAFSDPDDEPPDKPPDD